MVCLWHIISWPIYKIWPNRNKWLAEFKHGNNTISDINLQHTLSKDRRLSWVSPEPQAEDDIYKIDFGKYRVISEVEFYEYSSSNEFPQEYGFPRAA